MMSVCVLIVLVCALQVIDVTVYDHIPGWLDGNQYISLINNGQV